MNPSYWVKADRQKSFSCGLIYMKVIKTALLCSAGTEGTSVALVGLRWELGIDRSSSGQTDGSGLYSDCGRDT
jgi:hypothetical protein